MTFYVHLSRIQCTSKYEGMNVFIFHMLCISFQKCNYFFHIIQVLILFEIICNLMNSNSFKCTLKRKGSILGDIKVLVKFCIIKLRS